MFLTIYSSSHMAELMEKDCGAGHAPADVMKKKVLMNPGVAQLKDASLQHCHKPLHVQQDRV